MDHDNQDDVKETETKEQGTRQPLAVFKNKLVRYTGVGILGLLFIAGGIYGYWYGSTPEHIRKPAFEHYHFRTQIIVDGSPVDFSRDEFQQAKNTSSCSIDINGTPIDFHDKVDQMTHIHWDGITGGEFLKYYGWNLIGGSDGLLGRRFDAGLKPIPVKTFGKLLPPVPANADYYVYLGDQDNYEKKDWNDFLHKDLEEFFGRQSNLGQESASQPGTLNWLFPKASAHGGIADEHPSDKSEQELTRINNLIGNVVIFVQENEPSKDQVEARFDNLVPLSDSTCGG